MARRKPEGIESLLPPEEPISIQEITMLDWFAAFAMFAVGNPDPEQRAKQAFNLANAMMHERKNYPT